jgi:S1-C subfamily serine protease
MRRCSGGPHRKPGGTNGTRCQTVGRVRWGAWIALQAVVVVCSATLAPAQGSWWSFGAAANPTATWSTDQLADYLYTGQTPHPAVARIVAPESSGASMGSGVLVDVNENQGLVLTNWHVVRESRSAVLVQFPDGFQSAGTVIRQDEAWDLAAIVIWKPQATPVSVAAAPPQPGEPLTIGGFGRGVYREQTGRCTEYLSPGTGYPKEFVELEATARQGDSGGPIFNDRRELAGVLFGQNEGRTIGSCSTRVKAFLASVGSSGFTPPVVDLAAVAASTVAASGGSTNRVAALPVSAVEPRSSHVPAAAAAQAMPMPALGAPAGAAWPQPAVGPAPEPSPLAGLGLPPWMPDPYVHRAALLSAAGGFALGVIGLRTIFGGRRAA